MCYVCTQLVCWRTKAAASDIAVMEESTKTVAVPHVKTAPVQKVRLRLCLRNSVIRVDSGLLHYEVHNIHTALK